MATPVVQGRIEQITNIIPSIQHTTMGAWCHQRVSYTNGGVTINYPAGLFSVAPIVNVTTSLENLTYSSDLMIASIITSNTTANTTIRINKETTAGGITEAATNDVFVNLFAISQ